MAVPFPALWTKSVVESVVLPAHAQTSPPDSPPTMNPGEMSITGAGMTCSADLSAVRLEQRVEFSIMPAGTESVSFESLLICDGEVVGSGFSGVVSGSTRGGFVPEEDAPGCGVGSQFGLRFINNSTNETLDCQIPIVLTTTTLSCSDDTVDDTATLDQRIGFTFSTSDGDGPVGFDSEIICDGSVVGSGPSAILPPGSTAGAGRTPSSDAPNCQPGDSFGIRTIRRDNGAVQECTVLLVDDT